MQTQARTLLAIPDQFRMTALSFPSKVDKALALIDTPEAAKELLDKADAMAHYANRVKADTEIVNSIQYGKLKIVAKLGELMPAAPPAERGQGRKGKAKESTPPKGIDLGHNAQARYRKIAKNKDKLDACFADVQENGGELTLDGFIRFATGTEKAGRSAHVSANTGIPEWYTPAEILDAAREVLGRIDLDPASSKIAQKRVKAVRFFTVDDDGLSMDWSGNLWMNPPYSADLVSKFMAKLCRHVEAGDVNQAVILVNNATETKWFQSAARLASAVCFPESRIKFLDENGEPGAPLQGQALLFFGRDETLFIEAFKAFGVCFYGSAGVQGNP